jgi:membrane protein YdbS with pleckstrin-like domain
MAREPEQYFELADGEEIKVSCTPAKAPRWATYVITLGLYEFWRRANVYAVTDRRVAARAGLITKTEGSLPLFYVQDATIQTFLGWGRVNVSTAGGDSGDLETNYVRKADAQEFRRVILELAHSARPQSPPAPTS